MKRVTVLMLVAFTVAGSAATQRVSCVEDMDCWDCKTMGNMICGPLQP